jgi:hypothetical protein
MERRGACQRSRQRTFFRKLFDIKGLSVYPSLCELVEGIVTGPRTPSHSDARTYYHAASFWISCVAGRGRPNSHVIKGHFENGCLEADGVQKS